MTTYSVEKETKRILLVDDNRALLDAMAETLADEGYSLAMAESANVALKRIEKGQFAAVVTDLRLPDRSGLELLELIKEASPGTVVIIITAYGSVDTAVEAMKLGAFDFVTKPFPVDELVMKVRRAVDQYTLQSQVQTLSKEAAILRQEINSRFHPDGITGRSPQIDEIRRNIDQLAASRSAVLILGETGTGKELVARAIHNRSLRAQRPFVRVNCAVFNENLLESELFGHEKGAFTGADQRRVGRFEMADTGTIFLDEIGELTLTAQAKMLRVLQEREFERVGGSEPISVDVRIVAATNRNLAGEVRDGRFREDLFYRLNVVPIQLPPLRERKEDIAPLLEHFLVKYATENHKRVTRFSVEAMNQILSYNWPGNVRELENAVERGVVLSQTDEIPASALPFHETRDLESSAALAGRVETFERRLIEEALLAASGNTTRAAENLGISRSTLRYKIEKHGLQV